MPLKKARGNGMEAYGVDDRGAPVGRTPQIKHTAHFAPRNPLPPPLVPFLPVGTLQSIWPSL
eukprot:366225-Chlamydomonas_euryale.AAC.5